VSSSQGKIELYVHPCCPFAWIAYHDVAVRHAARPTRDIVAELRTYADSRRLPLVTNYRNIGFDVLVHAQDIAIPRAGTIRCHPRLPGPVRTECGPWDGRSGPATGCADCGSSPPTLTGPPVLGSNCADRSGCFYCC
jgi:hypothetical protein